MSCISYERCAFFLTDGRNQKSVLLKVYEPLSNHSSLPMYESEGGKKYPVYDLLTSTIAGFSRAGEGVQSGLDKTEAYLVLLLIAKVLLNKHRDYRVLEIGCDNGVLSFILASLLRGFNPGNRLVCAANPFDAEGFRRWHHAVALSGAADIVSLVSGDFGSLPLPSGSFDIVVINGSAPFADAAHVVRSAVNLTKKHGLLICVTASQYLLGSCFQVFVDNSKEYYLSSAASVLTKTVDAADKSAAFAHTEEFRLSAIKQDAAEALTALNDTIQALGDPAYLSGDIDAALEAAIRLASRAEDNILAIYGHLNSLDIKFNVNELKEALISCRLCHDDAERAHFAAQCREKYQTLLNEMKRYSDW